MTSRTFARLEGFDRVEAALAAVRPSKIASEAGRAQRKGLRPALAAAKANAPVGDGPAEGRKRLRRTLRVVSPKRKKRRGEVAATLVKAAAPHAHFSEEGTDERATGDGRKRGRVTPRHWMRSAYQRVERQVVSTFSTDFGERIVKAAAKAGGGGRKR